MSISQPQIKVRHMVWSYWHVDLYATPSPRTLPSPRTMSADAQPTTSVSTTAYMPHVCRPTLRVDDFAVELQSTESLQRPRAPMSPRAHSSSPHSDSSSPLTRSQSLGTFLSSQSPRAPSYSQSPRARIPSPRACTPEPTCSQCFSSHPSLSTVRHYAASQFYR